MRKLIEKLGSPAVALVVTKVPLMAVLAWAVSQGAGVLACCGGAAILALAAANNLWVIWAGAEMMRPQVNCICVFIGHNCACQSTCLIDQ